MKFETSEFIGANVLDNKPFIVTPIMDNGNAMVYIQKHPTCDRLTIVCSIQTSLMHFLTRAPCQMYHVSLGLVYLHSQNIVHGDLKAVLRLFYGLLFPSYV